MKGDRMKSGRMKPGLAIALGAWLLLQSAAAFDLQGHRGARGLAPENTLPAFERALAIGVTTLELDVAITRDGVLVLQAQGHRSQVRNREEALGRLVALVRAAARPPTPRKPTKVSKAAKRRRVDDKKQHGKLKSLRRGRPDD